MSVDAVKPSKILMTTDFSESASCAFPYAVGLARRHSSELVVLHVITGCSEYLEENELLKSYEQTIHNQATARLACLKLDRRGGIDVRREVASAWSATAGIVAFAGTEKPDLIVMSTHGHRIVAQLVLGSVARGVIASAPCPVLCVKCAECGMLDDSGEEIRIERILVPIDLSEESRTALKLAIEHVKTYDAQLHLMYVIHIDVPPALVSDGSMRHFGLDDKIHSRISKRLQAFQHEIEPGTEKVVTMVEKGSPAKRIAHYAESNSIDLIILSRKGLGKTPHFLGSVVERLLHEMHCPMLVI